MQGTATRTRPEAEVACPTCGAPAETGQLICLECGSRIALAYRRPPSWRVPVAIVSVIVLAAAGGIYFGLKGLEDDADREVAAQPAPSEPERGAAGGDAEEEEGGEEQGGGRGSEADNEETRAEQRREEERAEREERAREQAEEPAGPGGVRSWAEGEDAYTVVILASEDQRSARAFAQSAVKAGTPAGVLRADDYPSLSASTGFFIVFVGTHPNQVSADRAAARLGRSFAGAYPQFVNGSKATR